MLTSIDKVETTWCENCFPVHGEGCKATTHDESGHSVCIFCADGFICPPQKHLQRSLPSKNHEALAKLDTKRVLTIECRHKTPDRELVEYQESKMSSESETSVKRACNVEGCAAELGDKNKSGYCSIHRHFGDPRRRKRSVSAERGPGLSVRSALSAEQSFDGAPATATPSAKLGSPARVVPAEEIESRHLCRS